MSDAKKWLQRAPGLLTFFMVIALGVTLANLLWLVVTPAPQVAEAASRSSSRVNLASGTKENYGKLIADEHLFGVIPKAAPVIARAPAPVKKVAPKPTNLNLKVSAILAYKNGNGYAMMSYNGKPEDAYRQGDVIPKAAPDEEAQDTGVSVVRINTTNVIINNNGVEQEIKLPDFATANTASSRSTSNQTASNFRSRRQAAADAADEEMDDVITPDAMPTPGNGKIETLAELREQAIENPNILMSVITPSIVRENGEIKGIRVYPSRNRELFRALGLRNGDVITEVNDVLIDGPDKAANIMQQVADSPSLTLKVIRGGSEQILNPQL
jgi:general secretion pathway protein C